MLGAKLGMKTRLGAKDWMSASRGVGSPRSSEVLAILVIQSVPAGACMPDKLGDEDLN